MLIDLLVCLTFCEDFFFEREISEYDSALVLSLPHGGAQN